MARAYHSASSDALGQRCKRAWWLRYGEGLKEAEVEWSDIAHYKWDKTLVSHATPYGMWADPTGVGAPVKGRQRSTALGKAMHSTLEGWYSGAAVDWDSYPGRVAGAGLHLLPDAGSVHSVFLETPIGSSIVTDKYGDQEVLEHDGILWRGLRDLTVCAPGEFLRLGIDAPDGWALIDYKSSSNIEEHAMTSAALAVDFAAQLYTLATCGELGIESLPLRWAYFETKAIRRAAAVDATVRVEDAYAAATAASARARELDAITCRDEAPQNILACAEYGGCPYHVSAGGPCDARRSLGRLIQLRTKQKNEKEGEPMAFNKDAARATFAKIKDEKKDAAPATPAEPKRERRRPPEVDAAVAATATADAPGSITMPGDHGPVTITGDARDVLSHVQGYLHA